MSQDRLEYEMDVEEETSHAHVLRSMRRGLLVEINQAIIWPECARFTSSCAGHTADVSLKVHLPFPPPFLNHT